MNVNGENVFSLQVLGGSVLSSNNLKEMRVKFAQ